MRLLYWFTHFLDGNGRPSRYHGIEQFEINLNTHTRYHFNAESRELSQEAFDNGELKIEGYFSLTHKAVVFADEVSLSARNKLTGSKVAQTESFVLIGQLGKSIILNEDGTFCASELSATELLNDAVGIIQKSSDYIISRNIIIECKPIEKIKNIYETYGFTDLQYDEQDGLHTLYLRLGNQITF
jgi:hypothetical protein